MKNIIYNMVIVLSLCFLGKAQAQNVQWTTEQTNKAQQEVKLVNEVVTLTADQKTLLTDIFLEKNQMLEEGVRVEWGKKVVLSRVEDIIRYGKEINRHPVKGDKQLPQEIHSKQDFEAKIHKNKELLEALNLIITEE